VDHRAVPAQKASWWAVSLICLASLLVGSEASAQTGEGRYPWQEYNERMRGTEMVAPLKSELFGDQISLYDTTAEFSVVDVDLPGNSTLPVQLKRRLRVESKKEMEFFGGFGEWDIEVPYIYGVFTATWKWNEAGNGSVGRCSEPWYPKISDYYDLDEIWSGNYLHLPGEGDRLMLYAGQSGLALPQDGNTYKWATRDFLSFSCKQGVANGNGEGFVLLTPQGLRYTFDVMIEKRAGRINKRGALVPRSKVFLAASKVEDRHGNWVEYRYSGTRLSEIVANDGRRLTIEYDGENIGAVTANGRRWIYAYVKNAGNNYPYEKDRLASVAQPDGRAWQYSYSGNLAPKYDGLDLSGGEGRACPPSMHPLSSFTFQATHPSGAVGTFEFELSRHQRTGISNRACVAERMPNAWRLVTPNYFDVFSLKTKTITGAGLETQKWRYAVLNPKGGLVDLAKLPCTTCEEEKTVDVFQPDGTRLTYRFGTLFYYNDGRLLGIETRDEHGNRVRAESYEYVKDEDMAGQPFPPTHGASFGVDDGSGAFIRPRKETVIWQDGETYVNTVAAFDAFARPAQVIKSNTLNYGRYDQSEQIDYHDNRTRWVLGQVERVQQLAPANIEVSRTEYDGADLPARRYSFGRLVQQVTYSADGTPSTVADALGNTTVASNWKRGTPQTIQYPDGSSESAVVDDNGWLTAVTGRNSATTSYQYDPVGRLTRIQQPQADTVAWNDTVIDFAPVAGAEYGIPAGHWRQTISTGDSRRVSYFDALWQPLVSETFDAGNPGGTLSQVLKRFDVMGRLRFESYPTRSLSSIDQTVQGTRTAYDALGRPVLQQQDSELGVLDARTEYLPGGQIRATNPRGHATLTTFMALDQPATELAVNVALPEGAFVDIERDSFGKPQSIRRRDAGAAKAITRRYVYDAQQQLCKSIEPESGATVMSYDAAGNLAWSASGLALSDLNSCSQSEAATAAGRVDRSYDVMNRLRTLRFNDGNGDQQWEYWPSGAVRQITTMNDGVLATNSYQYNKRGLLIGESLGQAGGDVFSLGYGYSANGHLASHQYPQGESITYAPNALGQPTQAGPYATHITYYPNGAMSAFRYGNGLMHTLQQNVRGLPERSTDASSATRALDDSYDYDGNGNVLAISDGLEGARGNRDMTYDGLDRLVSANSPMFDQARYSYDVLDNLTSVKIAGRNQGYLYDASNRLTNVTNVEDGATVVGLSYDLQGNLAIKNGQAFNFDSGNRLRQALGQERYRYDGHGRRVQSSDAARGNILSFYDSDGVLRFQKNAREAETISYVHLNGSLVARLNAASEPAAPIVTLPGYATNGAFTVQWSEVKGASRYELAERTDGDWNTVYAGAERNLRVADRVRAQYSYRARACNVAGCSEWGAAASIFVELPPTKPAALTVPALGISGSYEISWLAPAPRAVGETTYVLEEATAGGAWTEVQRGPQMSRAFTGRAAGSYRYQIKACNPYGCSPYTAEGSVRVVYPPAVPVLANPGEQLSGSYAISWTASAGTSVYQLDESLNGGAWARVHEGAGVTASLSGRQTGQYRYRVQACGEGGCSASSALVTINVTVAPSIAPTLSVPGSSNVSSYTVAWSNVAFAATYDLYERQPNGALVHLQSGAATNFAAYGRGTGRWGYAVRACNRAGCGPFTWESYIDVLLPPQVPAFTSGFRVVDYGVRSTSYHCYINWGAVPHAERYEVRNESGGVATVGGNETGLSTPRQIGRFPEGMACSTRLQIQACNSAGCSGWSPVWVQERMVIDSRI
jgi:YD repeat-containing protein